jgi:hypothetical protein
VVKVILIPDNQRGEMKIEIKGGGVGMILFTMALAILQCGVLYMINPSIFGISLGWRLEIPGRGRLAHEAFTTKTKDMDSYSFFMRKGEELTLKIDYEIEEGFVYTSVTRYSFPRIDFIYSKVYQESVQESHVFTAPRSGFYRVRIGLHKFKGVVNASWVE